MNPVTTIGGAAVLSAGAIGMGMLFAREGAQRNAAKAGDTSVHAPSNMTFSATALGVFGGFLACGGVAAALIRADIDAPHNVIGASILGVGMLGEFIALGGN